MSETFETDNCFETDDCFAEGLEQEEEELLVFFFAEEATEPPPLPRAFRACSPSVALSVACEDFKFRVVGCFALGFFFSAGELGVVILLHSTYIYDYAYARMNQRTGVSYQRDEVKIFQLFIVQRAIPPTERSVRSVPEPIPVCTYIYTRRGSRDLALDVKTRR